MEFLKQIFTWWNGQTIGTRFHTWRFGTRVGQDEFGNVYYKGGKDSEGRTRRWVIYSGYAEASAIPAGWHGWMHHRTDVSPADEDYKPRPTVRRARLRLPASGRASPATMMPGRRGPDTLLATFDR